MDEYGSLANFVHRNAGSMMKNMDQATIDSERDKYDLYQKMRVEEFEKFAQKHNITAKALKGMKTRYEKRNSKDEDEEKL